MRWCSTVQAHYCECLYVCCPSVCNIFCLTCSHHTHALQPPTSRHQKHTSPLLQFYSVNVGVVSLSVCRTPHGSSRCHLCAMGRCRSELWLGCCWTANAALFYWWWWFWILVTCWRTWNYVILLDSTAVLLRAHQLSACLQTTHSNTNLYL